MDTMYSKLSDLVDTKMRLFEEHVLGFRLNARVTDYLENAQQSKFDTIKNDVSDQI